MQILDKLNKSLTSHLDHTKRLEVLGSGENERLASLETKVDLISRNMEHLLAQLRVTRVSDLT